LTIVTNELVLTILLLAALVALTRLRVRITGVSRESFSFIAIGMAILTIISIARTFSGLGAFGQTPFVSDPAAFKLLVWIGVITGSVFLVSGVSQYLRLLRKMDHRSRDQLGRVELIKKTEQLVGVESRLGPILSRTLANIVELYGLPGGAVYCHDLSERHATLVSLAGSAQRCSSDMDRVEIDVEAFGSADFEVRNAANAIVGVPEELGQPTLVLPVNVGGEMYGLFMLWIGTDVLCDDALMNLRICLEVIARKIELDRRGVASRAAASQDQWSDRILQAVDFRIDLRKNLIRLAGETYKRFDSAHLSLAVVDQGGIVNRYTVGDNGSYLRELGMNRYRMVSHVAGVIESRETLVLNKIRQENETVVEPAIIEAGMRSLMAFPIGLPGDVRGVLTMASRRKSAFDDKDRALLTAIEPTLRTLVDREQYENELQQNEGRAVALSGLLQEAADSHQLDRVLKVTGQLLAAHLGMSIVRISLVERDRAFLQSCALETSHNLTAGIPADGHMVLSLMPQHQQVIDTGQTKILDLTDDSNPMTEAEICQALAPGVRSALLVPITVRGNTVGVVAMADSRGVDRLALDAARTRLAETAATVIGLSIQVARARVQHPEQGATPRLSSGETGVLDRAGRIKSSLSGILGSIEVLQAQPEAASRAKIDRYLSIIDKSARQLDECLKGEG